MRLNVQLQRPSCRFMSLAAGAIFTGSAGAQTVEFSVDWRSPSVGLLDPFTGDSITEGAVLVPNSLTPAFGAIGSPRLFIGEDSLGLMLGCAGHLGGTPCHVEVDALSHGFDDVIDSVEIPAGTLRFSTDVFGKGFPMAPAPPHALSEGPAGDLAADVLTNLHDFPPILVGALGHTGVMDGDGLVSPSGFVRPGLGLVEPRFPTPGVPAASGDDVDALSILPASVSGFTYTFFSLDGSLVDPLTSLAGTGSAAAHGHVGGDVLVAVFGAKSVYAPAMMLGLDLIGGPGSDDLDALIVCENTIPGFQPSHAPFAWGPGSADMLVFSVRRGSAVVGAPDSRFGIPITEGDLLTLPVAGGMSPFPAIVIPAESMGLTTLRAGIGPFNTELDAASFNLAVYFDCDGNGIEDAFDLLAGPIVDTNGNAVLDGCEASSSVGTQYCFCTAGAPCANSYAAGGCTNFTGLGAILTGSGSASMALDNLVLTTTQMTPSTFALLFSGTAAVAPTVLGNGQICAGGVNHRLALYPTSAGTASVGPGLGAVSRMVTTPGGWIAAGVTWHFQTWYRDVASCGAGSNVSNALSVMFVP